MAKKLGLRAVQDRVIILPDEPEKQTKSGLHLPDTAHKENVIRGKVVAVGPGLTLADGSRTPMEVRVGDVVLFNSYSGYGFEQNGQVFLVVREPEIHLVELV